MNLPSTARGALLTIEALRVSIGEVEVLRDVHLGVSRGEILGLVGASGSGKSMTALSVPRLLPPGARVSGSIRLEGEPLEELDEKALTSIRGREIGMIFQEPMSALNPLMCIGDQIAETVKLHRRVSATEARALARESLDRVGLKGEEGRLDRYPYELSGGQRQRVAIAIATVLSPALLIADEPTTALDVQAQAEILGLLRELARSRHMGLILVSHDLAVIAQATDRCAVMQQGRIVEEIETRRLKEGLRHPYAKALLAAAELEPKRAMAPYSGAPVLEAVRIVREYPRRRGALFRHVDRMRAVDQVSLVIHAGETVGLVGESGSGKSSLLRAILALDRLESGEVRLLGERFSSAGGAAQRRLRRSIQVVMQDPYGSFDPRWRVERLIAEPFFSLGTPLNDAERDRRVATALEQVGLAAADAKRFPHEFSGGQRQRIAIARALVTRPAVIAFDEAVSALDVLVRAQILALLRDLAASLRLAYLFVSHDLNVVRAIADRVYVMQGGRIVEEGPASQVFGFPKHAYTRALIAATPRIEAA
jgi:peptide/nickel transport system ATP-binding protein